MSGTLMGMQGMGSNGLGVGPPGNMPPGLLQMLLQHYMSGGGGGMPGGQPGMQQGMPPGAPSPGMQPPGGPQIQPQMQRPMGMNQAPMMGARPPMQAPSNPLAQLGQGGGLMGLLASMKGPQQGLVPTGAGAPQSGFGEGNGQAAGMGQTQPPAGLLQWLQNQLQGGQGGSG